VADLRFLEHVLKEWQKDKFTQIQSGVCRRSLLFTP